MRSAKETNIMGRRRDAEPRYHQLNLSLTASELESIKRRAEAVGMRPVHFGRALILDQKRKAVATETDGNLRQFIHAQLIRVGNNLNQMMRHLHRTGEPLPGDLEPLLKDIRQIIARVPR
jgi:hypothetical protein